MEDSGRERVESIDIRYSSGVISMISEPDDTSHDDEETRSSEWFDSVVIGNTVWRKGRVDGPGWPRSSEEMEMGED